MTPPEPGRVHTTAPATIAAWGVGGLLLGWSVRPVAQRLGEAPPTVGWAQVTVLLLVAAVLGWTAWTTRQAVTQRRFLEPHRAVNRLVLAKACALVGALAAGGYAGYALAWVGSEAALADQRMIRSGVGAVAGLLMCGAALLLERACRVPPDDSAPGEGGRHGAEPDPV